MIPQVLFTKQVYNKISSLTIFKKTHLLIFLLKNKKYVFLDTHEKLKKKLNENSEAIRIKFKK